MVYLCSDEAKVHKRGSAHRRRLAHLQLSLNKHEQNRSLLNSPRLYGQYKKPLIGNVGVLVGEASRQRRLQS